MGFQEKMLAQRRDNDTSTHTLYTRPASTTVIIKTIEIVNTTGSAATYRLFFHNSGTTYDQTTACGGYDTSVAANSTVTKQVSWAMDTASGTIGYQQGTANALTITVFGVEIT